MDLKEWKSKAEGAPSPEDLGLDKMDRVQAKLIGAARPFRANYLAVFDGDPTERDFGQVVGAVAVPDGIRVRVTLENADGYRLEVGAVYGRAVQLGDELIAAGRGLATKHNGGSMPQPPPNLEALVVDDARPFLNLGDLGASLLCEGEPTEADKHDDPTYVAPALVLYFRHTSEPGDVVRAEILPQLARAVGLEVKRAFRRLDRTAVASSLVDMSIPLHQALPLVEGAAKAGLALEQAPGAAPEPTGPVGEPLGRPGAVAEGAAHVLGAGDQAV